jgi:hypothetical protein
VAGCSSSWSSRRSGRRCRRGAADSRPNQFPHVLVRDALYRYRFAVIDGHLLHSPAKHVRRPKLDYESTTLGLDRIELGALFAHAAASSPVDHALACLLGLWSCACPRSATLMSSILGWNVASHAHGNQQERQDRADSTAAQPRPRGGSGR